ncbi:MAG: RNA polymerase sigma factor [Gemmataceae bacterium]
MGDLLEELAPRVYRFALRLSGDRHAAEDVTQEAFLRAWRTRDRLREPRAARVWLFRIVANVWRDRARRGRLPVERAGPLVDAEPCRTAQPERLVAGREELARALAALDALPPRQRDVLYLTACEGLTATEVADVLDINANAVKANLSLARKAVRQKYLTCARNQLLQVTTNHDGPSVDLLRNINEALTRRCAGLAAQIERRVVYAAPLAIRGRLGSVGRVHNSPRCGSLHVATHPDRPDPSLCENCCQICQHPRLPCSGSCDGVSGAGLGVTAVPVPCDSVAGQSRCSGFSQR